MDQLVTTEWLANELGASDLRVVDATMFLPSDNRNAVAEFEAGHIPGAVFMDLSEIVDTANPLPMMLPGAEKFASRMQSLGLGDGSRIVIYDNSPWKSAPRAWWMLSQVFGAHAVAVLDGGLAKWTAEGRPLESGKPTIRHRHFTAWKNDKVVRDKAQMRANIDSKAEQVVDARGAARFTGEEADPRPNVGSGHIPGSRSLPYSSVYNADGTWKRGEDLKAVFAAAGIDLTKPLVATCGSGLTASSIVFGAHLLGMENVALYDGSWSDWGSDPETPKATGTA
ncbi:3-mercaptopyruvate sulfurtransferase [Chakrabartia godavariana]|nr:3-mercaptopyruvate sulfurtransferase [Chakrabartia godavariana]